MPANSDAHGLGPEDVAVDMPGQLSAMCDYCGVCKAPSHDVSIFP